MSRSNWKTLNINKSFLRAYLQLKFFKKKKTLIIYNKSTKITKFYLYNSFYLHKGNTFSKFKPTNFFLGQILGFFILNRRPYKFVSKQKKF